MSATQRPNEVLPNPDPSIITTAAIDRAITNLEGRLSARLDAIEKASDMFHTDLTRVPTLLDRSILGLREFIEQKISELSAVTQERFNGIGNQFSERDVRTEQRARDTKLAVDAAFAAAKESTSKIEAAFTKQIDAMINILDTKTVNLADAISDIKVRLTAIESRTGTVSEVRKDSRENTSLIVAIVGVAIAIGVAFLKH